MRRGGPAAAARSNRRRPGPLAVLAAVLAVVLAVLGTGCPGREATRPELIPVPRPDLTAATPEVRRQIEAKQAAVDALSAAPETPASELAEGYGDLGLLYVTYTFLDAAEAAFENAQRLAPEDYRWPYLSGYLFELQGRLEEALHVLHRAVELAPADRPALTRLGRVRLEQGDLDGADNAFRRVLAADASSAAAHEGLGRVALARGNQAEAAKQFERTLALQPEASSVRHALGLVYRRLGRTEEARRALEAGGAAQVVFDDPLLAETFRLARSADLLRVRGAQAFSEGRFDIAAANYRKAVELEPGDFTTRKALGFSLQKLGDLDGAIRQLQQALDQGATGDADRDRQERAEVHRILGGLMVLTGREDDAIGHFRQAVDLDPALADARLKLANALARQGELGEAVKQYDRLLGERPRDADILVRRATAEVNLGQRDEALADFRRAVAMAPDDPEVRLRYADALEFLGHTEQARRERATARADEDGPERARLAAERGVRAFDRGELEEAEAALNESLRLDPTLTGARYRLATILGHQGHYREALDHFRKVIEDDPHHAGARYGEAAALLLLSDYATARDHLDAALQRMPADRRLAHLLARLLAAAPDAAVRNGDRAVEMARRVYVAGADPAAAETLAMALAESGRFEEAVAVQQQALSTAGRAAGEEMERRLESYRSQRPWHATSPAEILAAAGAPAD